MPNGGDVFSLQKILGHSSLKTTRRYCELADMDIKEAHAIASPVDNLKIGMKSVSSICGGKSKRVKDQGQRINCHR